MSNTSIYSIWAAIKRRCQTPTDSCYYKYGARGIKMCDRWQKFENFYEDMGDRPSNKYSIDRIDNDGDYSPENCRWADNFQQASNKRNNRHLTVNIDGEELTKIIPEWSRISGVSVWTIRARLKNGVEPYKAVFTKPTPFAKF